jgi:hypothetical protein
MNQDGNGTIHYWIFGARVTILGGVIAFISLYPQSHFLAFMILAASCSLVAVYQLYTTGLALAEIAVCIVPIFGLALVGYHVVRPNLPAETENHGWLIPADLPSRQQIASLTAVV